MVKRIFSLVTVRSRKALADRIDWPAAQRVLDVPLTDWRYRGIVQTAHEKFCVEAMAEEQAPEKKDVDALRDRLERALDEIERLNRALAWNERESTSVPATLNWMHGGRLRDEVAALARQAASVRRQLQAPPMEFVSIRERRGGKENGLRAVLDYLQSEHLPGQTMASRLGLPRNARSTKYRAFLSALLKHEVTEAAVQNAQRRLKA